MPHEPSEIQKANEPRDSGQLPFRRHYLGSGVAAGLRVRRRYHEPSFQPVKLNVAA
jgi:hypothetical protein